MSYELFEQEQTNKLKAIFASLDAETFDKESVKTEIDKVLKAQANYGKTQYDKKQQQITKFQQTLNEIGYDPEKYKSVDEFKLSLKEKVNSANESDLKLKVLNEKISNLESLYNQEKETRSSVEKKAKNEFIKGKLTEVLSPKVFGASAIIENTLLKGELDIVDDVIVTKDGKSLDDFVTNVLDTHKDAIKVEQKSGSGVTPTKNVPNNMSSDDKFIEAIKAQMK
jgi:translation initiation factor 2 beta subunit (eIF-2beta)/eIF-5